MTILKYLFILVLIIGAFVWLSNSHLVDAAQFSQPISIDLNQYTAPALAAEHANLPEFNGVGVVFIDMSSGAPGVPYVAYETPKDHKLGI